MVFTQTFLETQPFQPASEWQQAESSHRLGPKTVPAQTAEVMTFSLFALDFKPKVLVVVLFCGEKRNSDHFDV